MYKHSLSHRSALSLVELLIAIAIFSILFGLVLAATQRVRESAYRASCMNNLKQIGLAMQVFHTHNGFFPHSGGLPTGGNRPPTPTIDTAGKQWGVGDPRWQPANQPGPWSYSILSQLDYEVAYRQQLFAVDVKVYMCPTRRRNNPQIVPATDPINMKPWSGFTYNGGGVLLWGKTDYAGNQRIILGETFNRKRVPPTSVLSVSGIPDGTSNTILVGEKSLDPRAFATGGWFWDEPLFAGGGAGGTVRGGNRLFYDSHDVDFQNNWGSSHPIGMLFLYSDGSVRLTSYNLTPAMLNSLLTPAEGDLVPAK
jgi:prepilin-type N-terminal cleavage/methylation domain-containing protein